MGKKQGVRVRITFTKRDGTESEFWTAAPEKWDRMDENAKAAWVSQTAFAHHRGAQNATVTKRG